MSVLSVNGIGISFGEETVIKDISFELKQGSVTCIMGQSGCGKTTLINIILGLVTADYGTVTCSANKIAVVFQEDRLFEDYTALSNVKAVSDKQKALAALSSVGLNGEEYKCVKEMSGGMKRRVAIARAMAYEADLIIMDEPFKGLDVDTKNKVLNYILSATKGKTLLLVTHDESEAKSLNASVVRM